MKLANIGTVLPPRDERDWVTTSELLNETPITYRQLDYWCRTGLLTTLDNPTPGTGWTRRLHEDQITRARVIAALLDAGISGPVVRAVIDDVIATGHAAFGAVAISIDPNLIEGNAA